MSWFLTVATSEILPILALQTISQGQNVKFKDMSRTNTQGQGRGQILEDKDEDEDNILASRPTCSRGLSVIGASW